MWRPNLVTEIVRVLLFAGALLLVLSPGLLVRPAGADESFTLDSVREQVKRDYWQVRHLRIGELAERIGRDEALLLLDVREGPEFAVSHLAAAQRVDPGVWRGTFLDRFQKVVRGKTVVFYCSVGVRSSRLAAGVQAALKKAGAKAVYNLDGGIFAWHNEHRALSNQKGVTEFVHPFDEHWGRLLERQELIRTTP